MNPTTQPPAPNPDLLASLPRRILAALESLTVEQFAAGGDRPIREALAIAAGQK